MPYIDLDLLKVVGKSKTYHSSPPIFSKSFKTMMVNSLVIRPYFLGVSMWHWGGKRPLDPHDLDLPFIDVSPRGERERAREGKKYTRKDSFSLGHDLLNF